MKEQPTDPFLTDSQQAVCRQIIEANIELHSQRAKALLLIDGGATHREAAEQVNLSIGQVRYALIRFRTFGLTMFPPMAQEKKSSAKKKAAGKKDKKSSNEPVV